MCHYIYVSPFCNVKLLCVYLTKSAGVLTPGATSAQTVQIRTMAVVQNRIRSVISSRPRAAQLR